MPRLQEQAAPAAQLPRVELAVLDAAESQPAQPVEPQPEQAFLPASQAQVVVRAQPASLLPALARLAVAEARPVWAAQPEPEPVAWLQLAELLRVAEVVPAVAAAAADAPPLPSAA
jgi:hypothetical protein